MKVLYKGSVYWLANGSYDFQKNLNFLNKSETNTNFFTIVV